MTPPEALGAKARWLEELGYSHVMVPEEPDAVAAEMPDQWLEDLTLVGTPAEVVEKMRA